MSLPKDLTGIKLNIAKKIAHTKKSGNYFLLKYRFKNIKAVSKKGYKRYFDVEKKSGQGRWVLLVKV